MRRFILVAALSALPIAAQAESWSMTGPRGGTAEGSGTCTGEAGTLTCDRVGTVVTPMGVTLDRTGHRVTDAGGTVKTITTTGAQGRSVTVTRTRVSGD